MIYKVTKSNIANQTNNEKPIHIINNLDMYLYMYELN